MLRAQLLPEISESQVGFGTLLSDVLAEGDEAFHVGVSVEEAFDPPRTRFEVFTDGDELRILSDALFGDEVALLEGPHNPFDDLFLAAAALGIVDGSYLWHWTDGMVGSFSTNEFVPQALFEGRFKDVFESAFSEVVTQLHINFVLIFLNF
jgi:hypothetical protein